MSDFDDSSCLDTVALDELRETAALRPAVEAHVRLLAAVLEKCPPILVDRHNRVVIDGHMRVAAAHRRGWTEIPVRWVEGSEVNLLEMAVAANSAHGLPLTRTQRMAAAKSLLDAAPAWSNRRIASAAGVSEATVRRARRPGATSTHPDSKPGAVVGIDGKTYPVGEAAQNAARQLLTEQPDLSNRRVARQVGLSATTVGRLRQQAVQDACRPARSGRLWRFLTRRLRALLERGRPLQRASKFAVERPRTPTKFADLIGLRGSRTHQRVNAGHQKKASADSGGQTGPRASVIPLESP
jgi:ParB-like chromosome segregation protein Spo0J